MSEKSYEAVYFRQCCPLACKCNKHYCEEGLHGRCLKFYNVAECITLKKYKKKVSRNAKRKIKRHGDNIQLNRNHWDLVNEFF